MKNLCLILLCLITGTLVVAQNTADAPMASEKKAPSIAEGWSHNNLSGITVNHIGLKNWSRGGDPAFSILVNNGYLGSLKKGKHLWQNSLFLDFGFQLIKGQNLRKGCDRLEFTTKYGFKIDKKEKWYISPLFGFKSQFAKAFNFANQSDVDADLSGVLQLNDKLGVLSKLGSPMTIELGLGIDYVPNDKFSLYMSPAAVKLIIVPDNTIAALNVHGNEGKNVNTQVGALAVATYQHQLHKNVGVRSILKLYKNYLSGPAQNIDLNWENNINLKVTKFISANLFFTMIYDYDIDTNLKLEGFQRKLQIKEVIGVGFSYNLVRKDLFN